MPNTHMHDLARMGAESRLAALDQERDEILRMFPDLCDGAGRDGAEPKVRKDHMSPEARKPQAERMRAYWAERRAKRAGASAKSAAKKSPGKTAKRGGMSAEARKAQAERMRAYGAAKMAERQAGGQAEATEATNGTTASSARKAGRKQGRKK